MKINKIKNKIKNKFGTDFLELIKHGKNYISADLFSQGLAFISIPIFTRLLIPEEYGVLAIFASFIGIFSIIAGLGVRGAVSRYYYEKTNDFNEYFGSNLIFILTWSILLSLFFLVFKDIFITFFKIPLNVYYLGIGTVFFSTTFSIYQAYLQASKQSGKIAKLSVFNAGLMLILAVSIMLMLDQYRYYGKIIAQIIVGFYFFIYSLVSILKISKINFKYKYIKYSLVFGIPVTFHLLSQFALTSFDQIIINQIIGSKETGLYSFAYKVGMLQNIISMGMLRAWSPMFYEKLNNRDYFSIEKLAKEYAKLVYGVAIFLILFSKEIIMVLADEKYYASLEIVPVIVISYVFFFLYTMYVNYAFYHKKTYFIALFTIIAGGINIGLNYLLIPRYGYQAAAWTTLISYACLFILHYLNVKFIIKPEKITSLKVLIPNFIILIILVLIFSVIGFYVSNYFVLLGIKILILLSGIVIFFGSKIKEMIK